MSHPARTRSPEHAEAEADPTGEEAPRVAPRPKSGSAPFISHVTPAQRDVTYNHQAAQAKLPITVHLRDGGTVDALMVLDPGQMQLFSIQVEWAIRLRDQAEGLA